MTDPCPVICAGLIDCVNEPWYHFEQLSLMWFHIVDIDWFEMRLPVEDDPLASFSGCFCVDGCYFGFFLSESVIWGFHMVLQIQCIYCWRIYVVILQICFLWRFCLYRCWSLSLSTFALDSCIIIWWQDKSDMCEIVFHIWKKKTQLIVDIFLVRLSWAVCACL